MTISRNTFSRPISLNHSILRAVKLSNIRRAYPRISSSHISAYQVNRRTINTNRQNSPTRVLTLRIRPTSQASHHRTRRTSTNKILTSITSTTSQVLGDRITRKRTHLRRPRSRIHKTSLRRNNHLTRITISRSSIRPTRPFDVNIQFIANISSQTTSHNNTTSQLPRILYTLASHMNNSTQNLRRLTHTTSRLA